MARYRILWNCLLYIICHTTNLTVSIYWIFTWQWFYFCLLLNGYKVWSIPLKILLGSSWPCHSRTLAWKIPWAEEPGGLQSMGLRRVRHDWVTSLSLFTIHFHALEKEMATHSSVLAWRIPGMGEPGGLPSMGSHRVGHDWSDLAAVRFKLASILAVSNFSTLSTVSVFL